MVDQWTLWGPPPGRAGEYLLPAHAEVATCRSCGRAIVWATTGAGKAIPLSLATVVERGGQKYALSHFADCPDAKDWSNRRS